jgi:hypothetical protein
MRKLTLLAVVMFSLTAGALGTVITMTAHPEQVTLCEVNAC